MFVSPVLQRETLPVSITLHSGGFRMLPEVVVMRCARCFQKTTTGVLVSEI